MEVRYWAWTNAVDAQMLTISSATRTAKLGRLMESPRIERVLFVQCSVQTSMCCKSWTNWFTKSLEKRFSKQSPYAYSTVEFRRSSTEHDKPSGAVYSFVFHLFHLLSMEKGETRKNK